MGRSELAVIIPAYNEQDTIAAVVAAAVRHADVIVVNDRSQDDTAALAAGAGAHVITNPENVGYERTLEAGFAEARRLDYTAVVTMDADGEHDPAVLSDFYRLLIEEQVPLVLGRRAKPARIGEYIFVWGIRVWLGIGDILCGCKGYRMEVYDANGGFDHVGTIGTELAAASVIRGYAFRELSIPGEMRADAPRFGGAWRANKLILRGFMRLIGYLKAIPTKG